MKNNAKIDLDFKSSLIHVPLNKIYDNNFSKTYFDIGVLAISKDLIFVHISAEVCNDIESLIPQGNFKVIKVGCTNFTFGYLPTDAMVHEGGYEVSGHIKHFGLTGTLNTNIDKTVRETVASCFRKINLI